MNQLSFFIKNTKKIIFIILIITLVIMLFQSEKVKNNMDSDIYKKINVVSKKNIYFGHQSVGENIISTLRKINSDYGENRLIIKELQDTSGLGDNYFLQSLLWQNGDPKGKFKEFKKIIDHLANKKLNIAMMKLCFVDITKNTNINELFKSYSDMIDTLRNKYPDIKIIHITVPLKSKPSWINYLKDQIKGRYNYDQEDNLARNNYNELICTKYSEGDIFDLAREESTYPDGRREYVIINGKPCYTLINDYTSDGGHLNDLGKQIVSEKFIQKIFESIKKL